MFEDFEDYLKIKKLSPNSIHAYITNLRTAQRFLGKPLDKTITKEDIQSFLSSVSNMSANTILMKLLSLKLYFRWLYGMKKGYPDVVDFPLPRKPQNKLVSSDLITEEDIERMVGSCDVPRDKALITLLFDSACRIGEIRGLNIEDVVIETERTGYIVVEGKTGRRQVPLSLSIPALRDWINSHPLKSNPKAPIFTALNNRFGHRLTEDNLRLILLKSARRIGLKKRIFCHLFRHSRLTQLDKKGLSHTAMKYYAGWTRNSNMPAVYSHLSAQDTKDMIYQLDGVASPKIAIKKTSLEPLVCPKCSTLNDKSNKFCYLCGMSLDGESRKEFEIEQVIKLLIKSDSELKDVIGRKLNQMAKGSDICEKQSVHSK